MKKALFAVFALLLIQACVFAAVSDVNDSLGVSVKAGPTDPTENLSIAWIETALYPKNVEKGKEIFIEVTLTSKVDKVAAILDFDKNSGKFDLYSDNGGTSWSRVIKTPADISSGVHVAKVEIESKWGRKVTRTLDFAVIDQPQAVAQNYTYPVTVLNTAQVIEDGQNFRELLPGVKVTVLYQAPFYRVKLSDAKEGWIEASKVNDPAEEANLLGYKAFVASDFENAVTYYTQAISFDNSNVKAHYWLAKTYVKLDREGDAAEELKLVIKQNPTFPGAQELAFSLGQKFYNDGLSSFKNTEYKDALATFRKTLDLMPNMVSAWIKIGETYSKIDDPSEARIAWREALKVDPENADARNLLGLSQTSRIEVARTFKPKTEIASVIKPQTSASRDFVKDSVQIIETSKTTKGTSIASAVKSVMSLTRSMGTKIYEDGWKVTSTGNGFLVRYACRQERNGKLEAENFDWKVDPDSKRIVPISDNSKLLMNRW